MIHEPGARSGTGSGSGERRRCIFPQALVTSVRRLVQVPVQEAVTGAFGAAGIRIDRLRRARPGELGPFPEGVAQLREESRGSPPVLA